MLYSQIIILNTDGTIGCEMNDTWCQMMWYQTEVAGPHTYPQLRCVDIMCEPPCPACSVDHAKWTPSGWKVLSDLEFWGIKQELILYVQ